MGLPKEITSFPVHIEIPVQWGDMDSANHVNNLQYLRWTESARIKFFELFDSGLDFRAGLGPILAWQDCKYIYPLTYPDTVIVTCATKQIEHDHFVLECQIFSKRHKRIAAISLQKIVAYDYQNLRRAQIPSNWLSVLSSGEKSD